MIENYRGVLIHLRFHTALGLLLGIQHTSTHYKWHKNNNTIIFIQNKHNKTQLSKDIINIILLAQN